MHFPSILQPTEIITVQNPCVKNHSNSSNTRDKNRNQKTTQSWKNHSCQQFESPDTPGRYPQNCHISGWGPAAPPCGGMVFFGQWWPLISFFFLKGFGIYHKIEPQGKLEESLSFGLWPQTFKRFSIYVLDETRNPKARKVASLKFKCRLAAPQTLRTRSKTVLNPQGFCLLNVSFHTTTK